MKSMYIGPGNGCSCEVPCAEDMGPCTCVTRENFEAWPRDIREAVMLIWQANRDGRRLTNYEVGHVARCMAHAPYPHEWCDLECGCGAKHGGANHPLIMHLHEWLLD